MTTNTEHRRRETDKIDQVCIKYQLEKANARIIYLELLLERCSDAIYDLKGNDKEFDGLANEVFNTLPCNQEFILWNKERLENTNKNKEA